LNDYRLNDYRLKGGTTLDVSGLPAGSYQVDVRREGESWRLFPATLR
jgi:hypothetical protein